GGQRVSIVYSDFSFDPRNLQFAAESGPSESGLSFDSHGHKFTSTFVRPLMFPMYELRYGLRNPYYPRPGPLDISADPLAAVYRFALQPTTPTGPHPTNLVTTGTMHDARGCVVYRGRAFPTNYYNNVFVADPDAHIIHRFVVQENGLEMKAQRAPDEPTSEFLMSQDPSFRPVQLVNGPDGALYIVDMQDGNERGRIYRVVPEKMRHSKLPQLGKLKTYDLVSALAQGGGWHRDTAERILYERKDPAAPALLRGTLERSRLAQARVLALEALAGANVLTEQDVLRGFGDLDAEVREHAILLSERLFKNGEASDALFNQFRALAQDPSIRVRCQLAFTLGEVQRPEKAILLGQILARDLNNQWIQNAVLSSAGNVGGGLFVALAGDGRFANSPAGVEFLGQLARMIGMSGRQDAVTQTAGFLARNTLGATQAYMLLYALGDGLYRTRSSLGMVDTQGTLQSFYSGALNAATDAGQPEALRVAATRLLGVSTLGAGSVADWLLLACQPPTTPALQTAAVETLSRYDDPQLVNSFVQMWPGLAAAPRNRAVTSLLGRDSQVGVILNAVQTGTLPADALSSVQRNFLRTHHDPQVRSQATQLLGPVPMAKPQVIDRFKQALTLRGVADRGQSIFRQRCAGCHLSATSPQSPGIGPALLRARSFTKDQLLSSIVQPNVAVRGDYATQVLNSKEGQSIVGILTDVNKLAVTLRGADGSTIVWPISNIRFLQQQNWSIMPDGLEAGMSAQDMADLMECIYRGIK
ncbi:MAG TPA: hypothetical protein VL793_01620, partial [Patescibacteria group bacterium]|nr:hypothetical protein [Patescibacteria group bacterium]